jgi:hypothetical protein
VMVMFSPIRIFSWYFRVKTNIETLPWLAMMWGRLLVCQ